VSETKTVAKNTLFQFVGKIVTMLISMGVTATVTRYYGVEGYGVFSLIVGFPALFYIISDFGFNAIATRDLSVKESAINQYLGNIIVIRMVISLVLIFLASLVLYFFNYPFEVKIGILIGLLTIATTALYSTSNIGFQVKLRYDLSNIANSVGTLFVPLVIFFMITNKAPIYLIGLANVLAGVATVFFCYYMLSILKIYPRLEFDKKLVGNLLKGSLPIGLS
jgi:O-antigen/teichoic acid export membrane protein